MQKKTVFRREITSPGNWFDSIQRTSYLTHSRRHWITNTAMRRCNKNKNETTGVLTIFGVYAFSGARMTSFYHRSSAAPFLGLGRLYCNLFLTPRTEEVHANEPSVRGYVYRMIVFYSDPDRQRINNCVRRSKTVLQYNHVPCTRMRYVRTTVCVRARSIPGIVVPYARSVKFRFPCFTR